MRKWYGGFLAAMSIEWKLIRRVLMSLTVLLVVVMTGAKPAAASGTETQLFLLNIDDGRQTVKIPVFEFKDASGVRIGFRVNQTEAKVSHGATGARIKVTRKSSYFKQNYSKVSVKKSLKLAPSKLVTVKVTAKNGSVYQAPLTVTAPKAPSIKSIKFNPSTVNIPGEILKTTIQVDTEESLTCTVKIKNSGKKLVYSGTVSAANANEFIFYWDGTASSDNKAGYSAGSGVSSGTYKLTASLTYQDGTKKRTVKKTKSFTVKRSSVATATAQTGTLDAETYKSSSWPWKVILTGSSRGDYLAEVICRQILTPTMTECERARAIYTYVSTHYHRWKNASESNATSEKIDTTSPQTKAAIKTYKKTTKAMTAAGRAVIDKTDAVFPQGFSNSRFTQIYIILSKQMGDCYYAAIGMETLLRHAGIEADILHNTFTNNYRHFWSAVRIDGNWYIADAGMEGRRYDEGAPFVASHFLRGKSTMTKIDDHILHSTIDPDPSKGYVALYAKISYKDYPGR